MASKTIINDARIIYDGMMLNKVIGMTTDSENMEGWLWARHPDGQWVSICEIPDYKKLKEEVAKYKNYINELNSMVKLDNKNKELRNEIIRMKHWINDLHTGMYINCVYCGHRYGPGKDMPSSMADVLKAHIEQCPKHPMSELKKQHELLIYAMNKSLLALRSAKSIILKFTRKNNEKQSCRACGSAISCMHDENCPISNALIKVACIEDLNPELPIKDQGE